MFSRSKPIPIPAPEATVAPDTQRLEDVLIGLRKFGEVSLSSIRPIFHQRIEWYCSLKAERKGIAIDIRSDSHADPMTAALECRDRLKAAFAGVQALGVR